MYLLRITTFFIFWIIGVSITIAQPGADYSIKDKKSIRLYEDAGTLYQNYDLEGAFTLLKEATEKSPEFIEAFILMAQIRAERNDRPAAIEYLEKAISIDPNFFPNNHYFLGELYLGEGRYGEGRSSFERFLQTKSGTDDLRSRAELGLRSCEFAVQAMNDPKPFAPENLGPGVNTSSNEYYPCVTADSKTLLFTRLIDDSRARGGKQEDFFVSRLDGINWADAQPVKEINTQMNEGAPSLSPDGMVLIFTACELEGVWGGNRAGLGSCDLFFSQRIGEEWSEPQNLGEKVNSYYWDSQPSIASDGRTLYFVRGRLGRNGYEDQDIWVSKLSEDGYWQKPEKLSGKVNTRFSEESVLIHPDGQTLYFSSNGHPGMGGLDIFMSKLQPDGSWGEPLNLGYPLNTHNDENSLLVGADGKLAFFASDRAGGFGGLDLYQFELPEEFRAVPVTYASGEVYDALSYKKLEAKFELFDLATGEPVVWSYSDPVSGKFLVSLPVDRDYALNVSRPGYLFYSEHFSLKGVKEGEPYEMKVPLQKIKAGSSVVLNNVFFDTDKFELKDASRTELFKLVEFLDLNPQLRIEIAGHTDNVGSDQTNQVLSENRANAVVSFLIEQGVEPARLSAMGYGETKPVADNSTEQGRAKNRRTEFRIL